MELDSNLLDDSILTARKPLTPKPLAPSEPREDELREFGDIGRTRTAIYDNVLKATQAIQPISNGRHTLRLTNVAYQDPDRFSKQQQKQAILNRQTLARRMQGVWELVDDATGDVIDRKKSVIMSVPHMTERGTFINKGTEYALKNQQRLLPGIYTRIRDNGEIESHANILPGVGQAHRYYLDPAKGMFRIKVGQGTVGIMPLLKAMGATKEQLLEAWGRDLYASNFTADDPQEYKKLKEKFLSAKEMQGDENQQREALVKKFHDMQVDPEVTKRTLGKEYSNLSLDTLLDITKKLIRVSKKEDNPDDRDSLPFQQFYGPEDLFAERIARDKDNLRRTLLWKASQRGSLKNMPSSALNKQLHAALLHSGLGIAAEEINTAELLDKATAVTRLGEGGIPSLDSIPDEARSVQPSMFGFIDPLRTPECYDEKTEVMTKFGWKFWKDITEEDEFACLVDNTLVYSKAEKLHKSHYIGTMFGVVTDSINYLVTPNHRMCTAPLHAGAEFRIELAETLVCKNRLVSSGGFDPYVGNTIKEFQLPKPDNAAKYTRLFDSVDICAWAELLGWYIGEGNSTYNEVAQQYHVKITQSSAANPANCKQITNLLNSLPFTWHYRDRNFALSTKQLAYYFKQFGNSPERYIPTECFDWPLNARVRLFDSLMKGEGRKNKRGERTCFCTSSHKLALDFQLLAFTLGYSSRIVFEPDDRPQSNTGGCWIVHVHKWNTHQLLYNRKGKSDYTTVDYDGMVYCATVPGGLLYVRREDSCGFWCGNSGRAGVDTFLARGARKGPNNKLYVKFNDARTGKPVYKTPQQLSDLTIGFPKSLERDLPRVVAMRGGKMVYVPKKDIDLVLPSMEDALNPLSNLIPGKGQIKGQRLVMASRMTTQALPVVDAESPLVRAAVPGTNSTQSFEEAYADKMGALKAQKNGRVLSVSPDEIKVQYEDGTTDTLDIYNNFPLNRKTRIHQDPVVQPGQTFTANQLLAKSNYTDKEGATALGRNARTAYMVWEGKNFEDAVVISKSFAKKMTSEHIYQHELETNDKTSIGKKKYIQHFPSKYDKKTLENLDDNGVIKPGTEVKYGDPLILGISQKDVAHNRVHKQGQISYADSTVNWEHHDPGVVTDVVMSKNGPAVIVKSLAEMRIGDKLSGRMGDKGILADIIDDEDMPKDSQGRPFEVLANPLGLITRTNAGQMAELWLGKIAELQGKPFKVEDFDDNKDLMSWVKEQLQQHNLKDYEDVVDPKNERRIKNIATGNRFFMKLHHMSEQKSQGRSGGAYTAEGSPAKGGVEGSKRIGILESNALLAHGATDTLQDVISVRSNKNQDYWLQYMQGYNPKIEKVPYAYEKFVNQLKASGVNVVRKGTQQHIMALTDKDIDELAGDRELTNASGVDWGRGLQELPGGLFDKSKTGGHGGNQWSYFKLHEPMPNPVMEEPIRRILGLTQAKFEGILSGETQLDKYGTGPQAIKKALENINIAKEIELARNVMNGGKASQRDAAVRKLGYLKAAQKLGLSLADYTLTKVPVIPPSFRPVSVMSNDMPLVNDANYLYKELFEANENLKKIQANLGTEASGAERLATYRAFKAVTGLGDPIGVKTQEKNVQGFLKNVFGSSPKFSQLQRKLISTTVDNVGRGVIAPDPNLDMDQVGIPEDKAFKIYERFVTRNLVRRGMSLREAREAVKNKTKVAREMLNEEMERRPVYISRAPVLHKFGILAAKPQITKGDVLRVSPLIVKGFNADFDGNCCDYDTELYLQVDSSLLGLWSVDQLQSWESLIMRTCGTTLLDVAGEDKSFKVKIGDIPRQGKGFKGKDGQTIYNLPEGLSVLSYDPETCKPIYTPITKITIDENHACREVKTRSGRSVIVSDNESLCVFDTELGQVRKMKPTDAVGKLSPYVKQYPIVGNQFSFELGWWYAVLAADGWKQEFLVGYSKNDIASRKEFERIARECILDAFNVNEYADKDRPNKFGDSVKIHLSGKHFVKKVLDVVHPDHKDHPEDRAALYKKLPDVLLYNGSRECLLGLLSGAIDGDASVGWNTTNKNRRFFCRFNTSSPYLVESYKELLARLGVRYSVTVTPAKGQSKTSYTVCPSVTDLFKILPECRLVNAERKAIVAEFLATTESLKDDLDIVPISSDLANILSKLLIQQKNLYGLLRSAVSSGKLGRGTAKKILELVPELDHDHYMIFTHIVNGDHIHWDPIVSAIEVEARDVFDLEVPETKVFSANNGLIIWDTMNYHVPSTDAAVKEAYERLLPSKNLFSLADFKSVMHKPANEYITGLYFATQPSSDKPTRIFRNKSDMMKAYESGAIDYNDKIRILEP